MVMKNINMPKKAYHKIELRCYVKSEEEAELLKALYKQAHELLTARVNENNTGKPVVVFTADVVEAALGCLIDDLKKDSK